MSITILGIETSCDDTSAAILRNGYELSNVIAGQAVHEEFGGVVPELASRAHQQHIIPVVQQAMINAGITREEIDAVAFTRGPGLLGSLLVGTSFAKGYSLAQNIPLIEVNHLQAHILAHFIKNEGEENHMPGFPFLCLLASGGHTQLVIVKGYHDMEIIGQTIDDAAGEAFDKCAKVMGLLYPGGPVIDKLAKNGDELKFSFSKPGVPGFDYSFSGLKTSFLYFLRDKVKDDKEFIVKNKHDLAASVQKTIIDILFDKLIPAAESVGIKEVAIAGGVSANSALKKRLESEAIKRNWKIHIPAFRYTSDNAAMIAVTGFFKYQAGMFASHDIVPMARYQL